VEQVNSSNISAVDYDSETTTLTVVFRSGTTYSYAGVPQDTYEALRNASSPGRYFQTAIKDSYSGVRIG
jgi:hypothetical protein